MLRIGNDTKIIMWPSHGAFVPQTYHNFKQNCSGCKLFAVFWGIYFAGSAYYFAAFFPSLAGNWHPQAGFFMNFIKTFIFCSWTDVCIYISILPNVSGIFFAIATTLHALRVTSQILTRILRCWQFHVAIFNFVWRM